MTSGRPPGVRPSPGNNDELLQLDEPPVYNSGQRPPVSDDDLLQRFNVDASGPSQSRPSESYDEFVGGRQPAPAVGLPVAHPHDQTGLPPESNTSRVYLDSGAARTYSQTSDLHNYQRYSDMDDPDDDRSTRGFY